MKKFFRPIAFALLTLFSAQLLTSCFGKFALVNLVYKFNGNLAGKDMTGKLVKSLVMWVLIIVPVYQIAGIVDIIILNLIEFWSGTNPIAMKEGEKETQLLTFAGREFQLTGTKGKISVLELSGTNKGKETVLYFDNANTISVMSKGEKVKVADFIPTEYNFASHLELKEVAAN